MSYLCQEHLEELCYASLREDWSISPNMQRHSYTLTNFRCNDIVLCLFYMKRMFLARIILLVVA